MVIEGEKKCPVAMKSKIVSEESVTIRISYIE